MHNRETNEFDPLTEEEAKKPQPGPIFTVGQTFELNGVTFRVHKIRKKELALRPVKQAPAPTTKTTAESTPA